MHPESQALLQLGEALRRSAYEFVTVTPETHRRVLERAARSGNVLASSLRDVFGWNRSFAREVLSDELFGLLQTAHALDQNAHGYRSRVRFSTLAGRLFVHSAFPTLGANAVFFGPDTYRFASLLDRWAPPAKRLVDIGCGSGAGGIAIADRADEVVLADISDHALSYAEINAALAGVAAELVNSDVLQQVAGDVDLIISNPPYMRDDAGRIYRDGGGAYGEALSVRIVREALTRIGKHGTLILYTGAAVVKGVDLFRQALEPLLAGHDGPVSYEELDPDVFGDELERPNYAQVERIAAVGLRVRGSATR